uniref:Uncharacterized protein n=1 Tax=Tanacetum cinerariifolium TaxID=118510 RepID=A0A6L2KCP2_TANCI|nr:hypothetical protein [Tanacetum cinerariifolium]
MPDDEIMSISRHDDDSDKVTSLDDEMENLLGYDKKIRRALHSAVPDVLKEFMKGVNKQFHALNKLAYTIFSQLTADEGEKNAQAKPSNVVKTISSLDDSNEEDQPVTFVNENTALIQEEPQTSGASSDANPLVIELHSIAEPELEEPPVKKLRFTAHLFSSGQPEDSLTIYPAMTRSRVSITDIRKGIATTSYDSTLKKIMPFMEEGMSTPNLFALKRFRTIEDPPLTLEEVAQMIEKEKRLADLKTTSVKYEKALKKLTQAQHMVQEKELAELEDKIKQQIDRTRAKYIKLFKSTRRSPEEIRDIVMTMLLRMHNIIVRDSAYARQVATELMLVIESRHAYFEVKDIVEKNLDNYDLLWGHFSDNSRFKQLDIKDSLMRYYRVIEDSLKHSFSEKSQSIQVKDIVKEKMNIGMERHRNWTDKVKRVYGQEVDSWHWTGSKMGDADIDTLTMEQLLELTRGNHATERG